MKKNNPTNREMKEDLKGWKKLFWCWETICYSCTVFFVAVTVFGLDKILNIDKSSYEFIPALFVLPLTFMFVFAPKIYASQVKWESFDKRIVVFMLLFYVAFSIYGFIRGSRTVLLMGIGCLITNVLVIMVAKEEMKN